MFFFLNMFVCLIYLGTCSSMSLVVLSIKVSRSFNMSSRFGNCWEMLRGSVVDGYTRYIQRNTH